MNFQQVPILAIMEELGLTDADLFPEALPEPDVFVTTGANDD